MSDKCSCVHNLQYLLPAIQSRPEAVKISEDEFAQLLSDVTSVGRVSLDGISDVEHVYAK